MRFLTRLQIGLLTLSCWATYVSAEEVTTTHHDLLLRADLSVANGKKLQEGVVILQHGTLAHNRMEIIDAVAKGLNAAGYNTLAVNTSFGINKRPSSMVDCTINHTHRHVDAVEELATWVKWLNEQGVKKLALLGHSRGGNQAAWLVSEQAPNGLEKLILVAPATWNEADAANDYQSRYAQDLAAVVKQAQSLSAEGKADQLMDVAGFVYCEKAKASANAVLGYYQADSRFNTPSLLTKISLPTLVITASEDTVVKDLPAQLQKMQQKNQQIVTIDGADHFFLDLYTDELVEKVIEFIDWK